nr:hypothetical protein CFP56_01478 [Quercus suber]
MWFTATEAILGHGPWHKCLMILQIFWSTVSPGDSRLRFDAAINHAIQRRMGNTIRNSVASHLLPSCDSIVCIAVSQIRGCKTIYGERCKWEDSKSRDLFKMRKNADQNGGEATRMG